MRKVDKGYPHKYLDSSDIRFAVKDLRDFYSKEDRDQDRYDFHLKKEIDEQLRKILEENFEEKCGYCEAHIPSYEFAVIDRFRPYNGVRDGRTFYKDLYWWLTYDWDNLIYSCQECSQYKSSYFPIKGMRALSSNQSLEEEKKLLVHPCIDDPLEHIYTSIDGELIGRTEEGDQTIELLKLNRTSLVERRKNAIGATKLAIDLLTENPRSNKEILFLQKVWKRDGDIEFLNACFSCLNNEIDINPNLKELINDEDNEIEYNPIVNDQDEYRVEHKTSSRKKSIKTDFFPIEYIIIENFKSIVNLRIDFPKNDIEKHAWVALLGENGLGKSSILQAICIGISPIFQTGDKEILEFIRKGSDDATITIKERDSANIIITKLSREGIKVSHKGNFKHALIGYGSVRLIPNERIAVRQIKKIKTRYKNLIDPSDPINDIMGWLLSIYNTKSELFNVIAYSLKQLLPEHPDGKLTVENGNLIFEQSGITFNSFSDGYRSTISLALDIIYTLMEGNTDMDKLSGIVVIDELGNQLHPRWQMQIVTQLRTVFPKINFIISTHHPLCLRGLKANEIIVLNKDEKNDPLILDNIPDPSHLRVDQILTSPIFGLHSAIDPEIEREFDEYYKLLAKDNLSSAEVEHLSVLRNKIPKIKYLGDTLREELAIYVIDKLLAERVKGKNNLNLQGLKEESINRVRSIWNELKKEDEDE